VGSIARIGGFRVVLSFRLFCILLGGFDQFYKGFWLGLCNFSHIIDDQIIAPEDMSPSPSNPSTTAVHSLGQSLIPVINQLQDIFVQLGSASCNVPT